MAARGEPVLRGVTLACICLLAFSCRLFSVVKYESVIHEFDPYFNYRATQHLVDHGPASFWNWFDERSWYPLGRVVGGTVYPGLMLTAGAMHWVLHALRLPVGIQDVCVFTAPVFSALTSLATYGLVKEVRRGHPGGKVAGVGAGLCAALLVALVPSYISRSVAGSYDNEGVAIFAIVNVFYTYVKVLNSGRLLWVAAEVAAYLYMVACWGGYTFVINLIPIHVLAMLALGRYSGRLYIAFSPLVILGTLAAASVPVVGFNAVRQSEHFGAFFAFGCLQVVAVARFLRRALAPAAHARAKWALGVAAAGGLGAVVLLVAGMVLASPTLGWSGRSLTLLDPTYASKHIPIIASVSEHQPPAWTSYIINLHAVTFLVPAGMVAVVSSPSPPGGGEGRRAPSSAGIFLLLYGVVAVYFSGVMVRLMLVLAPAGCCLAGIAVSDEAAGPKRRPATGRSRSPSPRSRRRPPPPAAAAKPAAGARKGSPMPARLPCDVALLLLAGVVALLGLYVVHCVWMSAEAYSAPSIVITSPSEDGGTIVFDDFREAYGWLRFNTAEDSKVASWWDYGYQTSSMANRTTIVDNNTWNNTHIAVVGRAMASSEASAWQQLKALDVNYVLVVFGGLVGYPSDDINKFLWMVKIGGGVFPDIVESDFYGRGQYRVDHHASKTMTDCLMYRLSYHRFADASEMIAGQRGMDQVRQTEIGVSKIRLKYFEEVFTSEHWMARIYRLKDEPAREKTWQPLRNPWKPARAAGGKKRGRGGRRRGPKKPPMGW